MGTCRRRGQRPEEQGRIRRLNPGMRVLSRSFRALKIKPSPTCKIWHKPSRPEMHNGYKLRSVLEQEKLNEARATLLEITSWPMKSWRWRWNSKSFARRSSRPTQGQGRIKEDIRRTRRPLRATRDLAKPLPPSKHRPLKSTKRPSCPKQSKMPRRLGLTTFFSRQRVLY